jgi:hypothetical protein
MGNNNNINGVAICFRNDSNNTYWYLPFIDDAVFL